jgi:hypothetical protein
MTFCTFFDNCKDGQDCPRALTPKIQAEADRWWKAFGDNDFLKKYPHAPISIFLNKPECHNKKGGD